MLELSYIITVLLIVGLIILYSCWLLVFRLKRGEKKGKSFWGWLKNVLEGLWGI
jgi:hypothetical protein